MKGGSFGVRGILTAYYAVKCPHTLPGHPSPLLARRPRPVGELAEGLPVSRPAVSQHLRVLSDAGLVIATRDGSRRLYRVDPNAVAGMRAYLDRFWSDALAAFEKSARAQEDR